MTKKLVKGLSSVFIGDFQSERHFTPEGYLVAPAKISRTGIQFYKARELRLKGVDGNKVIAMWRPPEEVFDPESIASFESQPAADDHPRGGEDINAGNWKRLGVGDVHELARDGEYVRANKVIVRDQGAIEKVIAGKVQLSCGYTFDADMTPGKTPDGQAFDGVQRNIRGNHVAIVEAGRAGPSVRIADHDNEEPNDRRTTMLTTVKIGDSEFSIELDENTRRLALDAQGRHERAHAKAMTDMAESLKECKDALKEARDAHSGIVKERDAHKKSLDDAMAKLNGYENAESDPDADGDGDASDNSKKKTGDALVLLKNAVARCKALKAQIPTAEQLDKIVADRAQLVADAKTIAGDAIDPKGKTVAAIRSEAIGKAVAADSALKAVADAALGGVEIAKAPEADVAKAFATLVAVKKAAPAKTGSPARDSVDLGRRMAGAGPDQGKGGAGTVKLSGYDAWVDNQMTGYAADEPVAQ